MRQFSIQITDVRETLDSYDGAGCPILLPEQRCSGAIITTASILNAYTYSGFRRDLCSGSPYLQTVRQQFLAHDHFVVSSL